MSSYFGSLATQLGERAARATLSDRNPSSVALREFLRKKFEQGPGHEGSFLGQPVFEALFEYEKRNKTLEQLGTLHPRLVQLLDQPPGEHAARRFPKTLFPYKHQVAAWSSLQSMPARSAIVSTGTASGKTECFLVPILDDLVREFEERRQGLVGVRALFLYPLNALINSQRERLAAWTAGIREGVRFCLYNGATPEQVPAAMGHATPEEVLCRKSLRAAPPPILVTNATMLEYMLVRRDDQPIIERSKGGLRWIVLDEAHSYLGSKAAEVALLLRRVMDAFRANPKDVRFVATSATMGGENATKDMQNYLADLAGIDSAQVDVITGRRVTPKLDFQGENRELPSAAELTAIPDSTARRNRLTAVPAIRELRKELTNRPMSLEQIQLFIGCSNQEETLSILDYCSESSGEPSQPALLPLRGNYFMRTQPGVWACWNSQCVGKGADLGEEGWPFGAVYFEQREKCSHCESLVFEVLACKDCGEVYLAALEDDLQQISARPAQQAVTVNEFEIEIEEENEEDDETIESVISGQTPQLICSRRGND